MDCHHDHNDRIIISLQEVIKMPLKGIQGVPEKMKPIFNSLYL